MALGENCSSSKRVSQLDNEINKKQPLFRLMLTFQLRLKSSSERSVKSPFAAQIQSKLKRQH